jgi:peptidoglycan hydrolase-like protein with peptidoglycan-binding domain
MGETFPTVRQGDRDQEGTNVRKVQYLLRERGQSVGVDGVFGQQTDGAVRAFQGSVGLAVDGIVGPDTWSKLIVTVKRGSKGDAVRAVQSNFGFLNQDGDFGDKTDTAVRDFQKSAGVAADGIVGPKTWMALTLAPTSVGG